MKIKNLGINRRRFIKSGCALCAGFLSAPKTAHPVKSSRRVRIHVIYALDDIKQTNATWPNIGFDFGPVIERTKNALLNSLPDFEFIFSTAKGPVQAERILLKDLFSGIDGYIVYQMNAWNLVVPTIARSSKPVLFVDFKYGGSGGFLVYMALLRRLKAPNVGFVCSSNIDDLISAVRCFELVRNGASSSDFVKATERVRKERTPYQGELFCEVDPVNVVSEEECLRAMRSSKILAVGYPGVSLFGLPSIPIKMVSFSELNSLFKSAKSDEAFIIANKWQTSAQVVEGVSMATLEDSARMYLAMKELLKKHNANAITINCLVGFYGGRISAYPCLGFFELNNEGLIGACECDVRSASTMIMLNALTQGRPGYISDPVLDTAKRQIIYAHCVAPNRVFGPNGPANPFEILTHSEDRKGASVRSILPLGYMTTTVEVSSERRQILLHQAKAVGNDPDDRACRTKLVAEPVGDFEKLFTMWDKWGWHRVTVYGDLKEPIISLAKAMNYKVVQEA